MPKKTQADKESGRVFWERLNQLIDEERPFSWARKAGIPKSTFSSCLKKQCIFSGENLKKIIDNTGYSIDWLLTGKYCGYGPVDKDAKEILENYLSLSDGARTLARDILGRIMEEEKTREK